MGRPFRAYYDTMSSNCLAYIYENYRFEIIIYLKINLAYKNYTSITVQESLR